MALHVTTASGLTWRVKRLVLPLWMRPVGPSRAAQPSIQSSRGRTLPGGHAGFAGPAMLSSLLWCLLTLPLLPVVLLLRKLRLAPWTLEALARPWGLHGPPVVLRYEVRGNMEARRALQELAEALERGDGAPVVRGAERI